MELLFCVVEEEDLKLSFVLTVLLYKVDSSLIFVWCYHFII